MRALDSIVLASASPRRSELLRSLGLHVRVVPSGVDEGPLPGRSPLEVAQTYARAKGEAVAKREPRALVLAADTVVDRDGIALGKPTDDADARAMLRSLSGREHLVHTAYTLRDGATGRALERAVTSRVRFATLDDERIAEYVASGDPMDKAGAYGIQGRGAALVERIDGDFYTVMGFPLGDFLRSLASLDLALAPAAVLA